MYFLKEKKRHTDEIIAKHQSHSHERWLTINKNRTHNMKNVNLIKKKGDDK